MLQDNIITLEKVTQEKQLKKLNIWLIHNGASPLSIKTGKPVKEPQLVSFQEAREAAEQHSAKLGFKHPGIIKVEFIFSGKNLPHPLGAVIRDFKTYYETEHNSQLNNYIVSAFFQGELYESETDYFEKYEYEWMENVTIKFYDERSPFIPAMGKAGSEWRPKKWKPTSTIQERWDENERRFDFATFTTLLLNDLPHSAEELTLEEIEHYLYQLSRDRFLLEPITFDEKEKPDLAFYKSSDLIDIARSLKRFGDEGRNVLNKWLDHSFLDADLSFWFWDELIPGVNGEFPQRSMIKQWAIEDQHRREKEDRLKHNRVDPAGYFKEYGRGWKLQNGKELNQTQPPLTFLIAGLIQSQSLILLYGEDGHRKSLLAKQISICIAAGVPFLDKETKKAPVLYYDNDNGEYYMRERFSALAQELEITDPIDLHWVSFPEPELLLYEEKSVERLLTMIRELKIKLLVLDNLTGISNSSEENSPAMDKLMKNLRKIIELTGVTILLLHNTGKTTGTRERGHSSIRQRSFLSAFIKTDSKNEDISDIRFYKSKGYKPANFSLRWTYENNKYNQLIRARFELIQGRSVDDPFDKLEEIALQVVGETPGKNKTKIKELIKDRLQEDYGTPVGDNKLRDLLDSLIEQGKIEIQTGPRNASLLFLSVS